MPLITPIFSSYLTTFVATGGAPLAVGKQDAEENGGARRAGIIELQLYMWRGKFALCAMHKNDPARRDTSS